MARRRLAAALTLILASCALVSAQVPNLGTGGQEPSITVPDGLKSPRATMQTFLVAMNEGRTVDALETMDLGAYGVTREKVGSQIASRLLDVMNKTELIKVEDIPDDPEGEPYVWWDFDELGSVVIAKQPDGAWRFTASSIADIAGIWESVRDKEVVEGLSEIDLIKTDPAGYLKGLYPEPWQSSAVLGTYVWQITSALGLILIAFIAGALIRLIARLIVRSSLHIDEEITDKRQLRSLGRALSLIVNLRLIGNGLPFLDLPQYLSGSILFVLNLLNAIGWFWLLGIVWDIFVAVVAQRAGERRKSTHKVVVPVVSKFGRFVIALGVVVFFISQLGYDVSALLAGLGIGGLVFALAAKDSVENLFGSITILMEMPFGVGDWVKIGDIDGEVEEINLRSTRIRTFQDSLITMPNSRMITSHVENFGARRRRRLSTTLGIAYDTPPAKIEAFCARLRKMLEDDPHVWDDKRFVYFNNMGDSTLNVMLYCFIEAPTWQLELEYRDAVLRKVMETAEEMGVEFAFPTRTIVYANRTDA